MHFALLHSSDLKKYDIVVIVEPVPPSGYTRCFKETFSIWHAYRVFVIFPVFYLRTFHDFRWTTWHINLSSHCTFTTSICLSKKFVFYSIIKATIFKHLTVGMALKCVCEARTASVGKECKCASFGCCGVLTMNVLRWGKTFIGKRRQSRQWTWFTIQASLVWCRMEYTDFQTRSAVHKGIRSCIRLNKNFEWHKSLLNNADPKTRTPCSKRVNW